MKKLIKIIFIFLIVFFILFFYACDIPENNVIESYKQNIELEKESNPKEKITTETEEMQIDSEIKSDNVVISGSDSPGDRIIDVSSRAREQSDKTDVSRDKPQIDFIELYEDGSGDFPTLQVALDKIAINGVIFLNPGTYILEESLEIVKPVRLVGCGMDNTVISCDKQGYVIRYNVSSNTGLISSSSSLLYCEGITFCHEGDEWASVVEVLGGEINFYYCSFTGGIHIFNEDGTTIGGKGIRIKNEARGIVQSCDVNKNSAEGIYISEKVKMNVISNHCGESGFSSIVCFGESTGIIEGNECYRNNLHGIALYDQSSPSVVGNFCKYNEEEGIHYNGYATGIVSKNICFENNIDGIGILGNAAPTILDNIFRENIKCGICYYNNSSGTACYNECTGNKWGIYVESSANPVLEDNISRDNDYDIVDKR